MALVQASKGRYFRGKQWQTQSKVHTDPRDWFPKSLMFVNLSSCWAFTSSPDILLVTSLLPLTDGNIKSLLVSRLQMFCPGVSFCVFHSLLLSSCLVGTQCLEELCRLAALLPAGCPPHCWQSLCSPCLRSGGWGRGEPLIISFWLTVSAKKTATALCVSLASFKIRKAFQSLFFMYKRLTPPWVGCFGQVPGWGACEARRHEHLCSGFIF